MNAYALVLNAGAASLRFSVFRNPEPQAWRLEARGVIDGIGTAPMFLVSDTAGAVIDQRRLDTGVHDGRAALEVLAAWLRPRYAGARFVGVGHRVAHGGTRYAAPTVVTQAVLKHLRDFVPLAPLHQPYNVAAIEAAAERLPGVPQVACFDTSFHRGQPAVAEVIPLPRDMTRAGLQRYGFHGLSYEYIASLMPQVAPEIAHGRVIVAHLGATASLCAMKDGKSLDSTLGFTALDGVCMGTRPGAVDPGVILYLFQNLGLSPKEVETILYRKSGLLGISGVSDDMRVLLASGDPAAKLAIDYFVYRVAKEIGSLAAVLGGVDGLVFTAGIGENAVEIRRRICEASAWLGVEVNAEANEGHGPRISRRQSRVSAWVIPTNEELMIARHTGAVLGLIEASA